MAIDTRHDDKIEIEKGLKSKDSFDRKQAEIARERIIAEQSDPKLKQLHDGLVEAHRRSDRGKIEELHKRIEHDSRAREYKERIEYEWRNRKY